MVITSSIPLHHTFFSSSFSLSLHHVDKSIEYYELASKQGIALMKKKKRKEPGKQEGRGKGSGGWMSSIGGAIVRDVTHSCVH